VNFFLDCFASLLFLTLEKQQHQQKQQQQQQQQQQQILAID
jgi:hypothetical protein